MRFELTTLTLARLCSTPELRPRSVGRVIVRGGGRRKEKNGAGLNAEGRPEGRPCAVGPTGAGDEIRTHDPNLGKVMLYP